MKSAFLHSVYTFIVIGLLSFVFFNLSALDLVENAFRDFSYLDLFQSKKIFKNEKVNTDIVLVNIEQKNRQEIALLLEHISNQQPKVIGLDAIFSKQKEEKTDSLLSSTIKNTPNLVGGFIAPKGYSLPEFTSKKQGFINLNLAGQKDKVIRNFIGKYNKKNSFALEIAKTYNPNFKATYNPEKALPIKYFGDYNHFFSMSFNDVMSQQKLSFLKDKIVLLGYLGTPTGNKNDIEDKHFTPINKNFAGKSDKDMFGITIHANILNMLLTKNYIKPVSNFWVYLVSFICAFLSSLLFIYFFRKDYPWFGVIVKIYQFGCTFIILWISLLLFKYKSIEFPVFLLISSVVLAVELVVYFDYIYKFLNKKWGIKNIYS